MFKFLRRNKQQPQQAPRAEDETTDDESVDHLEEVLKPLFETIKPGSPEEYVGMYMNSGKFLICQSLGLVKIDRK